MPKDHVRQNGAGKRYLSTVLLTIAILALPLGSCSDSPGSDSNTIQVVDQRGKTVTLPDPVERVITIPIPAASMVYTLNGNADRLVGMNPSSSRVNSPGNKTQNP